MPLEAWAGTMASEPKERAPNKSEEWQKPKERRGEAGPQREKRRARARMHRMDRGHDGQDGQV